MVYHNAPKPCNEGVAPEGGVWVPNMTSRRLHGMVTPKVEADFPGTLSGRRSTYGGWTMPHAHVCSRWKASDPSKGALVATAFALALLLTGAPGLTLTSEEENTIAVYEKVAPSIVNITTATSESGFFFPTMPEEGAGSGIILNAQGAIVTNHHVVADAENIVVTVEEGLQFKAQVTGTAPEEDLALLRIDPGKHPLKPIDIGDSSRIQVGEKVLAVGNPFGLGRTLTTGSVSMVGRDIRSEGRILRGLIQTDASINPGNSGGGLVDSQGQLIGMNTLILSPTGANVGIGFAIPSSRIASFESSLARPWQRYLGWLLAILLVYWLLRRLYHRGADTL
jgi:S1-C subfamily serine protease